jgi:hypothetical protein
MLFQPFSITAMGSIQSLHPFSANFIMNNHMVSYSLRQKIYSEYLDSVAFGMSIVNGKLFVIALCILLGGLYITDLTYKTSFVKMQEKMKEIQENMKLIELVFVIFTIIFTKDVDSAS